MVHSGSKRLLVVISLALVAALVAPTFAAAISRSFVIARAEVWVAREVPYSKKRFATVEGSLVPTSAVNPQFAGYRTDCSGFVSMCLNLRTRTGGPLSLTTASLRPRLTPIEKSHLRPGDVILRPSDAVIDGKRVPYGHAVIFVDWTDETRKSYVGYHQSGSSKGTVRSVIRWGASGFWSAPGFAPYRYAAVRDRVKLSEDTVQ